MPKRCVVWNCSNVADKTKNIAIHVIPFYGDDRPIAKSRRKQWVDFVRKKRGEKWSPSEHSVICSRHFAPEDYTRRFDYGGQVERSRLIRDEVGVVAIPRLMEEQATEGGGDTLTERAKRKILRDSLCQTETVQNQDLDPPKNTNCKMKKPSTSHQNSVEPPTKKNKEEIICDSCNKLEEECRKLKNQVINLMARCDRYNVVNNKAQKQSVGIQCNLNIVSQQKVVDKKDQRMGGDHDPDKGSECEESDSDSDDENEMNDPNYFPFMDDETVDNDDICDENESLLNDNCGSDLRKQSKFIVFWSRLLLLFQFCHVCKADNPLVEMHQTGTMVTVKTTCQNPKCPKKQQEWKSQPYMTGTRISAGNFLLSFGILMAGGSASKVFQIFAHMGLACISLSTYFKHQREKLFPSVYLHWKKYQAEMLAKLRLSTEQLTLSGDGRHDSMGHSAKFAAYTMFCCTTNKIIDFSLVQRNETGSSPTMEYLGFQRCIEHLLGCGLSIGTFISDRHIKITQHMKEKLPSITHYFDLWHLKKKIRSLLSEIAKRSGYEQLKDWIQPCINHLHWSATSTFCGNGRIIHAKFKSFFSHVLDKHTELDDPLYNKCAHGEDIPARKWLLEDSDVYKKMVEALTNNRLVAGIKKASPLSQTSCLEGFHSLLNHFCPKMIAYSYVGMFCRHIIATLHFNKNLMRDEKRKADGTTQVRYIYPKFKNGKASVRNVRVLPNFDYVSDIYNTFLEASKDEGKGLLDATKELKEMTPLPMNTMLEKESKEAALSQKNKRDSMSTENVPPTTALSVVLEQEREMNQASNRMRVPHCRSCKNPMRGHHLIANCPKNINRK